MATRAVCSAFSGVVDANDNMTFNLEVTFYKLLAGVLTTETAVVPVVVDIDGLMLDIHEQMVTAIVNYAAVTYSWQVARTRVIHPLLTKGLLV